MDFSLLKSLIGDLLLQELTDAQIADWCNTPSVTIQRETFVTTRTLMARLNPEMATSIIESLKTAAASSELLALTVDMMVPAQGGIDVSLDSVRTQLNGLQSQGVLDANTVTAINSLGEYIVSPAESVGLPVITAQHIEFVRVNHDD